MKVGDFFNMMLTVLVVCSSLYITYRKNCAEQVLTSGVGTYADEYGENMTFSDLVRFL